MPVAMSTSSAQILASKYHVPLIEPRLFGEMADSRPGPGKVQNEPGISYVRKQRKLKE